MTTLPWSKGLNGVLRMAVSEKTRISLTIASMAALVIFVGGGAWQASNFAADIKTQIAGLRRDITTLSEEQMSMAKASENALRMAMANPGVRVPDPRNPGQFFEVRNGVGK